MKPGIKFLRSVLEVAHVEFQTYDVAHHKLLFSSGVAVKMLGYSPDEYRDLSTDFYKNIIHPDDLEAVEHAISMVCRAKVGEIIQMTIRVRKKGGDYIWVYSRQMIYQKDEEKSICTIVREVEDVTRLVEIQNQLKEKVEQLKIVSYKNSHLLRSPVASVIGLVGLIEEQGITTDHNREVFAYLKEAIVKLDEVIHEINDASRH
jgi:PAS domain S-box-containing protein